ncbi:MAG TPA: hypothetical protein VLC07_04275, partial [Solirubrobacterales bacterium]|nr:hypothetical protein [Solirubrobacterales bacterium]
MPRSSRLLLVLICLVVALVAAPAALATPGDLDPSFGSGGSVRLLITKEEAQSKAVTVQPDLKVVVAGFEKGNCVVVRLLPNGEPDPSFGSEGKVTTVFPGGVSGALAVTVQPDGKIVVAGTAAVAGNFDFFFARYLPGGALDPGFGGGDGIETVPVGAEEDEARSVAVGPDGRIVAVGEAEVPVNENALAVVVLKADGTPDPSFGGDGSLVKETAAGDDRGVAGALLGDGSVLLGDENGGGGGEGFTLIKLLPGGGFDPGFGGGDGIVTTPIAGEPGMGGRIKDFALRPDGRIVASGYGYDKVASAPGYDEKYAAVGYLANGELDPTFGEGGIFSHQVAPGDEAADAVELTPDGKVLLAGFYYPEESNESTALLRLRPNGTLDPGFGSNGQALRGPAAPFGDVFEEAALDAEERLVTVSTAYIGNETTAVEVSRYLGDPRPPKAIPISSPAPATINKPAHAKMKPVPKKVRTGKLKGFFGSASDPDGNSVQK